MKTPIDKRGFYRKFKIERTDGSSEPGGKHENCAYFVLDLKHDKFAKPALRAYEKACREECPELARDIRRILVAKPRPRCGCREAHCPHVGIFTRAESPHEEAEFLMAVADRRAGKK